MNQPNEAIGKTRAKNEVSVVDINLLQQVNTRVAKVSSCTAPLMLLREEVFSQLQSADNDMKQLKLLWLFFHICNWPWKHG